jgi:hypothetical protein
MIIFIDENKKEVFIVPPKCGNTTIAKYLDLPLHIEYSDEEIYRVLIDNSYKKIILFRDIFDRFLSGFYEDLNNNSCYSNIDMSFLDFCEFLNFCMENKLKNVDNLNCFDKNLDREIWWGECSNTKQNIINDNGEISGHMISQENSIKILIQIIEDNNGDNVYLLNITDLNNYLNKTLIENSKTYNSNIDDFDFNTHLSVLKKQDIFPQKKYMINERIQNIIQKLYNSDNIYLDKLKKKYNLINYTTINDNN